MGTIINCRSEVLKLLIKTGWATDLRLRKVSHSIKRVVDNYLKVVKVVGNWGCKIIYTINNQGKKHGPYKIWYDYGDLRTQSNYRDDKLCGLYKKWYGDGTLCEQSNYRDGKLCGLCEKWYYGGDVYKRYIYINGVLRL